jgi:hypothetical protein
MLPSQWSKSSADLMKETNKAPDLPVITRTMGQHCSMTFLFSLQMCLLTLDANFTTDPVQRGLE